MVQKRRNILKSALVAGVFIAGSSMGGNLANALAFETLGSGSEVRTNLLKSAGGIHFDLEQKCGEKTKTKQADKKGKEAKCGNDKETKKDDKKAKTKSKESKSKEAKCGEGKCGN